MNLYAFRRVQSREATLAASTSPILPVVGLSSARANVPTERDRHMNLRTLLLF